MQATVRDLNGDDAGSIELPAVFSTPFRPDLIQRAVVAAQANRKQAYGADKLAGMRTQKTQEVLSLLEELGVAADIERADDGKTVRAGRGTSRGRTYKTPKSILFVTSEVPSKAARNLAGADVATAREVNVEDLAPGTHAGRLTLFTESAIEEVADR